jgi:hypothetical protein
MAKLVFTVQDVVNEKVDDFFCFWFVHDLVRLFMEFCSHVLCDRLCIVDTSRPTHDLQSLLRHALWLSFRTQNLSQSLGVGRSAVLHGVDRDDGLVALPDVLGSCSLVGSDGRGLEVEDVVDDLEEHADAVVEIDEVGESFLRERLGREQGAELGDDAEQTGGLVSAESEVALFGVLVVVSHDTLVPDDVLILTEVEIGHLPHSYLECLSSGLGVLYVEDPAHGQEVDRIACIDGVGNAILDMAAVHASSFGGVVFDVVDHEGGVVECLDEGSDLHSLCLPSYSPTSGVPSSNPVTAASTTRNPLLFMLNM